MRRFAKRKILTRCAPGTCNALLAGRLIMAPHEATLRSFAVLCLRIFHLREGSAATETTDSRLYYDRRPLSPLPRAAESKSLGRSNDPERGQGEGQTSVHSCRFVVGVSRSGRIRTIFIFVHAVAGTYDGGRFRRRDMSRRSCERRMSPALKRRCVILQNDS